MSKILAAMQRRSGNVIDFAYNLETIDSGGHFPVPAAEQMAEFERLANTLINLHTGAKGVSVTFAATVSGEGSSFVSYNVARHLSLMLNKRVVWIDANFQSPAVRSVNESADFRTLLEEPAEADCLMAGRQFVVLPNGSRSLKQTDFLVGENYRDLLDRLSNQFSFCIVDAPPISASIDVGHLARPTLGAVVVIEARRLRHEVVRNGINNLRNQGVNVLGTVLNRQVFDIPAFLYNRMQSL